LINSGNTNTTSSPTSGSQNSNDLTVANSGNGAGSTNSGIINTENNAANIQTNTATVANNADLASISGKNDSSYNTGDTKVVSGDANTTATVINGVNTNIDGVAVVEFNVDDTHRGDIILSAPTSSGCTASVCGVNGTLTAKNTGNGADSTNTTDINSKNTDKTFQANAADVANDLTLTSDSGHNDTSYNTGGNNEIQTGNSNVVATVGNFLNNSIGGAGSVLVNVVNIFGDLVGNILLPQNTVAANPSGDSITASNTGNGADSTNTAAVNTANTNNTTQVNTADIVNNVSAQATTGNNKAKDNTTSFANGGSAIETGDATVNVNAINIANNNIANGDTWWLVFVNDASGKWVGQIMGAPAGATMAGSAGTQFIVQPDGTVLAQNAGNGAGSTNTGTVNSTNTNSTTQNNDAKLVNNITLAANTGSNNSSYNTGGTNTISTGNANVMANIMNFVNNNFVGGKVVVSLVNVFGSWLGSFAPPGTTPPPITGAGGTAPASHTENNSGDAHNSTSDSSNDTLARNQQQDTSGGTVLGSHIKASGQKTGWLGIQPEAGTSQSGNGEVASGTVVNDDTITVPVKTKVASAVKKSWIPVLLVRLAGLVVILFLIKRMYTLKNSHRPNVT
jgi:hypothetical protein